MQLHIDTRTPAEKTDPLWGKIICAGRAAEGLRADWQAQFRSMTQELHFDYIRFHGLFHDEMFVCRRDWDGKLSYNFMYIDKLFDFLLSCGVRPIVELGFMPECLASGDKKIFWWQGNVTPPRDYAEWGELVNETVRHFLNRYGLDEVKQWYFEVWNEASYHTFWGGTQEDYFKLYAVSARTIKAICPELQVGGPATTQVIDGEAPWVKDTIAFCQKENLPLDFISFHPYPNENVNDSQGIMAYRDENSTRTDLQMARDIVDHSPFPKAKILLTEWNSSYTSRDWVHDTAYMAPFIVQNYLKCRNLVDGLGYWTFTDVFEEGGIERQIFHGGFGALTIQGLKKPAYHGFWFLNQLGDACIAAGDRYYVTRKGEDSIQILLWNYAHYSEVFASGDRSPITETNRYDGVFEEKEDLHFSIAVEGFASGCRVNTYYFDRTHGSIYDAWLEMGAAERLSEAEMEILRSKENLASSYSVCHDPQYTTEVTLPPHAVCLINLYKIY
ncbi:MAG TPA: beta-xylosidase [Firmicutes bacterium]|nr:beta-xylosidase [Bacillota bacterium]